MKSRLRSSMVERATHNRLVTGSNPVGATNNRHAKARLRAAEKFIFMALLLSLSPFQEVNCAEPGPAESKTVDTVKQASTQDNSGTTSQESGLRGPLGSQPVPQDTKPQELLPPDTVPLGVDQFSNPVDLTSLSKGTIGKFIGRVSNLSENKPCRNCTGLKIYIQNQSKNPIIVDGEGAQAFSNAQKAKPLSEDQAMHQSGGTFTAKQKGMLALAAATSLGLAEPLLQDHFSTSKTDFPVSYGIDETRRRLENRQLGKRIILPGEDTEGIVFFNGNDLSFERIRIPILSYPQETPAGELEIVVLGGPNIDGNGADRQKSKKQGEVEQKNKRKPKE